MAKGTVSGWGFAGVVLVGSVMPIEAMTPIRSMAPAQTLSVGSRAPELDVSKWVHGKPVEIADGKHIVVVEFWATWCPPCRRIAPYLTQIQKKYRKGGVRVVGMTTGDHYNTLRRVTRYVRRRTSDFGYAIGFDADGSCYDSYMKAGEHWKQIPMAFIADRSGRIAWIGNPLSGLDSVLDELVSGTYDLARAKEVEKLERSMRRAAAQGDMYRTLTVASKLLRARPHHWTAWLVRYRYEFEPQIDAALSKRFVEKLLGAFADRPYALAELVNGPILSTEKGRQHLSVVIPVLEKALSTDPDNFSLRVAHFRALATAGRNESAVRAAKAALERVQERSHALHEFSSLLASKAYRTKFTDLALAAVDLSIATDPGAPEGYRRKFELLVECKRDIKGAEQVGRLLIDRASADPDALNEFAWSLLTAKSTKGKFNDLALAVAERMYRAPGGDRWMFVDTLALAKFETGAKKQAVELQRKAVKACDDKRYMPELEQRLERYEEALRRR